MQDPSNYSDYLIQPWYVTQPTPEHGASSSSTSNDLQFVWSNSPSFNFGVIRKSTGDVIFSTTGSKLVFEDQFVEFKTVLPPDWNLQGLGETIHTLRLLNNHNITIYAVRSEASFLQCSSCDGRLTNDNNDDRRTVAIQ